jgi:ABC-type nitrate/sulfonate/bicarbonate transport system permease component
MRWSLLSKLITALVVVMIWEMGHQLHFAGGRLPSLLRVVLVFTSASDVKAMALASLQTLTLVFKALGIGGVIGYGLGLILGLSSPYLSGPYHGFNAVKSTPVTVLIPVFLSIFGLGRFLLPLLMLPIIAIMATNVAESVVNINNNRKDILALYGVGNFSYLRRVLLHELAEPVFSTLRVVVPFAIALEVAIDYFLNINGGLGTFIAQAYQAPGRDSEMYAGIIVVSFFGIGAVAVIDRLSRKSLVWKRET